MAENTKIEWTEATWNPVTGCSLASPGCTNCYAMRLAGTRLQDHPSRAGLTRESKAGPVWTGEVRLNEEWLDQPLRWRRPRMIFVCAHGDLFHESVPDEWIDKVFAVMALAPQHTFQVLTKRSARMREYLGQADGLGLHSFGVKERVAVAAGRMMEDGDGAHDTTINGPWPLPNVWLGVSVEDQARADERIPDLLATPAAVRWISAEPLLGPVRFRGTSEDGQRQWDWLTGETGVMHGDGPDFDDGPKLDWIVAGGESGPGARPMHPDWARSLRDQCAAAGVPFFFKQWGEWVDWRQFGATSWRNTTPQRASYNGPCRGTFHGGEQHFSGPFETRHDRAHVFARKGKAAAGRLLDGVEHNAMPGVRR